MRKIILISHGNFAGGALSTLNLFTNQLDNVCAINAYTDSCPNPEKALDAIFSSTEGQIIVFSDILFGSVNQLLLPYLSRPNTYIFSGFNLPMLLELISLPENASEDEIAHLELEGKNGVVFMNRYQLPNLDGTEDE